jgi:hypothetical protein
LHSVNRRDGLFCIFCQALPLLHLPMNPCVLAPDLYIFIRILANLSKLRSTWVRGWAVTILPWCGLGLNGNDNLLSFSTLAKT